MAEPPAKRAKRTDSSTMWDRNSSRATDLEHKARTVNESGSTREKRDDRDRYYVREERRHRSRSKDRGEKRRDRSRSRERDRERNRDGGRHRKGDRGDDRDKKDRKRSTSRERHRSRRGI